MRSDENNNTTKSFITLILVIIILVSTVLILGILYYNANNNSKNSNRKYKSTVEFYSVEVEKLKKENDKLKERMDEKIGDSEFTENSEQSNNESGTNFTKADKYEKYADSINKNTLEDVNVNYDDLKKDNKAPNWKIIDKEEKNTLIFEGLPMSSKTGSYILDYVEDNEENHKKYDGKYYAYNRFGFTKELECNLYMVDMGDLCAINGLPNGCIATKTNYNLMPRDVKNVYVQDFPETIEKALEDLNDENTKFACSSIQKVNLNGDKDYYFFFYTKYINLNYGDEKVLGEKTSLMVYDDKGNYIDTIASFCKEVDGFDGWEFDEEDIMFADVDNDGKIELLVNLQVWEGLGVGTYKIENDKVLGDTNIILTDRP